MPKKEGDEYIISETGNWNVADQYTKNKIMRPLNLCDYYEDIAMFGYESIAEEIVNYAAPPNDVIRVKAIKRLIKQLLRLIDNAKFALRKPGTKDTILKYRANIEKLDVALNNTLMVSAQTGNIRIKNHVEFENILSLISRIKSKINEPLNKNHLIFTDKSEFDAKAFKDRKKRRMEQEG